LIPAGNFATEHRLMLLSAGTRDRRRGAGEHMKSLLPLVNWSRLTGLLQSGRLLPTLGPRILELSGEEGASEEFKTELAGSLVANRRQDALLQLISVRAIDVLAAAGIDSTALKGPLLGESIYHKPGRRLSSDIDLLVAPERLDDAVEVVRGMGYARPADHVGKNGLPLLHFSLAHERGELPPVELHWRIHWYESRFARERLLPPDGNDTDGWRPAPTDELTALLLFYARDGFSGLRQATDLGAWWDRFGAGPPVDVLGSTLRAYPDLRPVLQTAARMAERTVGLPVDRIVGNSGELGFRGRVALRLADPRPYASREQLYAETGLIDGLLMPPGDWRAFIRRQIAPPREVIRDYAQSAAGTHVESTVGYSVRALGRYGLALARLLRLPGAVRARFVS
jgi:hypothetical protein